jgi:hypothetical protein
MENVVEKVVEKIKIYILHSITFFSENFTIYEIIPKNMVETEWPQMTSQYGAYALYAGLARLHALMRMHTPTHRGCMHARTYTDQQVVLTAFPR